MSNKHEKVCTALNYIERFFILDSILAFQFTGCILISAFASLLAIPIRITSSSICKRTLKTCAITAGIKMYNSIIKKKEEKT